MIENLHSVGKIYTLWGGRDPSTQDRLQMMLADSTTLIHRRSAPVTPKQSPPSDSVPVQKVPRPAALALATTHGQPMRGNLEHPTGPSWTDSHQQ